MTPDLYHYTCIHRAQSILAWGLLPMWMPDGREPLAFLTSDPDPSLSDIYGDFAVNLMLHGKGRCNPIGVQLVAGDTSTCVNHNPDAITDRPTHWSSSRTVFPMTRGRQVETDPTPPCLFHPLIVRRIEGRRMVIHRQFLDLVETSHP